MIAVTGLLVRAVVGDDHQYNPSGLAPFAVAGPLMLWYGAVVVRRGVRALATPGRQIELRPMTATDRRRRDGLGKQPREDIDFAWLVAPAPGEGDDAWAIPVDPDIAAEIGDSTTPVVRGRWEPGGHVALEYPDDVVFPIGAVQTVPADLPRHVAYWRVVGFDAREPFWSKFQRTHK